MILIDDEKEIHSFSGFYHGPKMVRAEIFVVVFCLFVCLVSFFDIHIIMMSNSIIF